MLFRSICNCSKMTSLHKHHIESYKYLYSGHACISSITQYVPHSHTIEIKITSFILSLLGFLHWDLGCGALAGTQP